MQTIVLSTSSDTFLRVDSTFELGKAAVWVDSAEEDGLVLVHAGIGEEQGRIVVWDC